MFNVYSKLSLIHKYHGNTEHIYLSHQLVSRPSRTVTKYLGNKLRKGGKTSLGLLYQSLNMGLCGSIALGLR